MRKFTAPALLFIFLFTGVASAGTVILTGSCSTPNPQNSTFLFNLSNSGNDSAINLAIIPHISGATPSNSSYEISSLPPGSNTTISIRVSNITEKGAHTAVLTSDYEQGSSHFSAIFPCLLYFSNRTTSQIEIAVYPSSLQDGNSEITVTAFNAGSNSIRANLSLALPPVFNYTGTSYPLDLAPNAYENVTFQVSLLPSSLGGMYSTYGAAAFASYSIGNSSYATMRTFSINPATQSAYGGGSIIFIAAAIAVFAVAALTLFSILRKKRRRG
jgi:hypothetical protein